MVKKEGNTEHHEVDVDNKKTYYEVSLFKRYFGVKDKAELLNKLSLDLEETCSKIEEMSEKNSEKNSEEKDEEERDDR